VAAVISGNLLEFYDFLSFSFFAVSLARVMFPKDAPGVGLLLTLMTGSLGFFARPIGAAIFGVLGDRIGRKPSMLITFSLMGLGALGMALTPTYAGIGIAAPVLVVSFRLIQGLAAGGDVGPTSAYLAEAGPVASKGVLVSLQYAAMRGGALLSGVAGYIIASSLPSAQLDQIGWRIAFGLGAAIVPFAFLLRSRLDETLHVPEDHVGAIKRLNPRVYVLTTLGVFGGLTPIGLCDFFYTFAVTWLKIPQRDAYWITIFLCTAQVACSVLGGYLADRYGRRLVKLIPWAIGAMVAVPLLGWGFEGGVLWRVVVAGCVLSALVQVGAVAALISFVESTPKTSRSGLIGIGYGLAVASAFGIGPPLVAQLVTRTHDLKYLAYGFTTSLAFALVMALLAPESRPEAARLRYEAKRISAPAF
jgi:MFS family permease